MEELKVFWKDINIMNIFCYENLYFNLVNPSELIEARKKGFILSLISNVSILSLDLPNFIKNRIPKGIPVMEYIKSTNCILETDDICVRLAENS